LINGIAHVVSLVVANRRSKKAEFIRARNKMTTIQDWCLMSGQRMGHQHEKQQMAAG
jgi:hypothetical protein